MQAKRDGVQEVALKVLAAQPVHVHQLQALKKVLFKNAFASWTERLVWSGSSSWLSPKAWAKQFVCGLALSFHGSFILCCCFVGFNPYHEVYSSTHILFLTALCKVDLPKLESIWLRCCSLFRVTDSARFALLPAALHVLYQGVCLVMSPIAKARVCIETLFVTCRCSPLHDLLCSMFDFLMLLTGQHAALTHFSMLLTEVHIADKS